MVLDISGILKGKKITFVGILILLLIGFGGVLAFNEALNYLNIVLSSTARFIVGLIFLIIGIVLSRKRTRRRR